MIRREVYLNEGDVFNTELLKLSIRRINQLGLLQAHGGRARTCSRASTGDDKLDVTFKVEEQNRNQFTFGGGVSGLEGAFLNASFQTANFLGSGETFTLSAQTGARTKNYQLAVTEPYFLDRPITAGRRPLPAQDRLPELRGTSWATASRTRASGLTTGLPVGPLLAPVRELLLRGDRHLRAWTRTPGPALTGPTAGTERLPIVDPVAFGDADGDTRAGSRPSWVRNTVDNPYTPRSGTKLTRPLQVVGGPAGRHRQLLPARASRPSSTCPAHAGWPSACAPRSAYIRPFGEHRRAPLLPAVLPGRGDPDPRLRLRTVAPVDARPTRPSAGTSTSSSTPSTTSTSSGPLRFLLFFDAGEAYPEGQGFNWRTLRTSTGAELRFLMPVLNVPFRLIYAWNANRDDFQPRTGLQVRGGHDLLRRADGPSRRRTRMLRSLKAVLLLLAACSDLEPASRPRIPPWT